MKRVTLCLFLLGIVSLLATSVNAQQAVDANLLIGQKQIYNATTHHSPPSSGARTLTTFDQGFFVADINHTQVTGGMPTFSEWAVNRDFATTCPPSTPADTADNFTVKWAAVIHDTIYDEANNMGYSYTGLNYTIDSVYFEYRLTNISGADDTIVVSILQPGVVNPLSSSNGGVTLNNTILWSDSIITSTSTTTRMFRSPVNLSLNNGGFIIQVNFIGPKEDEFILNNYFRDECGQSCFAAPTIFPGKSVQYLNLDFPLAGGGCNSLSGLGSITVDCNQNSSFEPDLCEEYLLQNWGIGAVVTADILLESNLPQGETIMVCTTSPTDVSVVASGGTPPYSYRWKGPGTITNATQSTAQILPATPFSEVYTVDVIDALGSVTARQFTVVPSGNTPPCPPPPVSATADTQIICYGDTGTLMVNVSGGTGHYTYEWSPSTGLDCDTCANPQITPDTATSYTVIVSDSLTADTATVHVHLDSTIVSTITITLTSQPCCINNNDVRYDALITGGGATPIIDWFVSGALVATGPFFTSPNELGPGVNVQARLTVPETCDKYSVVYSNIDQYQWCVGIDELEMLEHITVFPNPITQNSVVQYQLHESTDLAIEIYNLNGQLINTLFSGTQQAGSHHIEIESAGLSAGVYLLQIEANGMRTVRKLIKQ